MASNALSEKRIVTEALLLLNERGFDEVSLRNIASRLGVKAPSLARHVGDKNALLARMSESIFRSCLAAIPPCSTWQQWLLEFGRALWTAQTSVRDAPRLIAMARYERQQLEAIDAELSEQLHRLGIERSLAVPMQSSVQALITGWNSLAHGASGAFIEQLFPVEVTVLETLQRLIDGWSQTLVTADEI